MDSPKDLIQSMQLIKKNTKIASGKQLLVVNLLGKLVKRTNWQIISGALSGVVMIILGNTGSGNFLFGVVESQLNLMGEGVSPIPQFG